MAVRPAQKAVAHSQSDKCKNSDTTEPCSNPDLKLIEGSSDEEDDVEDDRTHDSCSDRMYEVLKSTLQFPASTELKASKLAGDIVFMVDAGESVSQTLDTQDLWDKVLLFAGCAPPHHPWHAALIEAIKLLHQREGPMFRNRPNNSPPWKDLSYLDLVLLQLYEGFGFADGDAGEMTMWKNQNFFVPRLLRAIKLESPFAIWQLRATLESPWEENRSVDGQFCQLWVASSWLIEQGDILFAKATAGNDIEKYEERSLRTGPLCPTEAPWSRDRWDFWKKRLPEVLVGIEESGKFDKSTSEMVKKALRKMEEVEESKEVEDIKRTPEGDEEAKKASAGMNEII